MPLTAPMLTGTVAQLSRKSRIMPITVHFPAGFKSWIGKDLVELEATTVHEALRALDGVHPGLSGRVLTEEGTLRPHLLIFVGRTNIRDDRGLSTTVSDGDEIIMLTAVSGGKS